MAAPLIIGCGTADRGDDAAGLLVARRLRALGVPAREHSGDGLALMELWRDQPSVILIDTVVTGGAAGAVAVWDGADAPLLPDTVLSGTHAFGVAEAVKLSRVLGTMPPRLQIYGIEGRQFELGAAPGPEVVAAAENLAGRLSRYTPGAQPVR